MEIADERQKENSQTDLTGKTCEDDPDEAGVHRLYKVRYQNCSLHDIDSYQRVVHNDYYTVE